MSEPNNDKLAMKMMRIDINRILLSWDPLCVRGLRGGDREYEQFAPPLSVMARKGEDYVAIARHLDELVTKTWNLPSDFEKCVEVATRIYNVGAVMRGEEPRKV